jgi:PAS domain S-box-containing protein
MTTQSKYLSEAIRRWLGQAGQSDSAEPPLKGEELFSRFMRHLPGLAWLKDPSGRFVYANDAAMKAFAPGLADIAGKTNADLLPPDAAEQCDRSDREAAGSESGIEVLETYVHADGTTRIMLVNKFPIADSQGRHALLGSIAMDITERRHAEEQLRLSADRLRLATEAGNIGVWEWDLVRRAISWTGSLYSMYGLSHEQFDGTPEAIAALIHPDDRQRVEQSLELALSDQPQPEIEFRAVRPHGEVVWLSTKARAVYENGVAVRLVGVTLDINQRKRTELALRESEERFSMAFNASPLSLTLSSLTTGKLLEVNETFTTASGFTREEAIGRTTVELNLWMNTTDREKEMAEVRGAGKVRKMEYRFRSKQGKEILGLVSAERIVIGGEPCALTVIEDVTERELAQKALRASEERLRLALRSASAGVWTLNITTEEIFWSDEFEPLYGYDASTPRTFKTWLESILPEDRERVQNEIARHADSFDTDFRHEFRIVHPQRGIRWILHLGRIDRDESGHAQNFSGINIDITERKQMEDELRETDQRKNEFLATLAHELRNPLAPIRNGLEILRLTRGNGEAAEQARGMMDRQVSQMVRLIDDLLDLSRISRGKIELRSERVELTAAIRSALEISQPLIDEARHELTVEVPQDALFVDADQTRLAQVFANLINNAAKYTDKGGHIWLTVRQHGAQASISVRDNGIGIPAQLLPRVFEMFTQGHRSSEKTQGGLGIGLSIAKRLVEMHGGAIEARSDGPGTGSEFVVHLPLLASETVTRPALVTIEETVVQRTGLRVLIADDNSDSAASLALMLKLKGKEVRTARDGLEAVQVAELFLPQVVLLDIGMPHLNGYDACRRIRQLPMGRNMLVVAMTGWGQEEDKRRSSEAGFDYHLVKPVDAITLEQLLENDQRS